MPNTHRWRRRDSSVQLSRVGVASALAVCIEFATSSRRLPTKIWKLNMLRIYSVELSRVELCRRCVHARRLSWPSLQFCSLYVTGAVAESWTLGHDWWLVRSHRRHDAIRLGLNLQARAFAVSLNYHNNVQYLLLLIAMPTYIYLATGSISSIDLTLCSPTIAINYTWSIEDDTYGSDHFPVIIMSK